METIREIIVFLSNIHEYLNDFIADLGIWIYPILFIVVFCETGLVFTPFLPGDSLLFAAGTFAALGSLDVVLLLIVFTVAAVGGDSLSYWIGSYIGPRAFNDKIPFLKKEYLNKTYLYYSKYGGQTVILARFVPMMRSFAPFVGGIGKMKYRRFFYYNAVGGIIWTGLFTLGGYFFGSIPAVKNNFGLIILGILLASISPWVILRIKEKLKARKSKQ